MTEPTGNYIAEWFGHRVFPVVAQTDETLSDQQDSRCPFLTEVTGETRECVKRERSKGVCTISSTSNGPRQDWLVCPFRALDLTLLQDAATRLFGHSAVLDLVAAPVLADPSTADAFRADVVAGHPRIVYFQNQLGGEIRLSATERSPEFSFDATMVEVLPSEDRLTLGRYGVFEIQTMDFHGTYAAAVQNLNNALHLHQNQFGAAVAEHPEWLGERVEGPNIANVFKRTFYQMMFKFQIGSHEHAAGCVFAIPTAVWDSWQRHLGKPELVTAPDGTYRLAVEHDETDPASWIYVFDLDVSADASPNQLSVTNVIGTSAQALSHYALDVAPRAALEEGSSADRLLATIQLRLGQYLPEFRITNRRRRARSAGQSELGLDDPS
jgi:Restriction endonuclease NotI